ncbi:hypothetical protein GQ600_8878 [Phytophthora cactorum]|nr:hypothetical protein GQ600_8878 [Phytophthora cactorum]
MSPLQPRKRPYGRLNSVGGSCSRPPASTESKMEDC